MFHFKTFVRLSPRLPAPLAPILLAIALFTGAAAPAKASDPSPTCAAPHIQAHLKTVEAELLRGDVSRLTPTQRESRARQIAILRGYREACVYPQNTLASDRLVPIFVDGAGVHCAVGYLMMRDGRTDLVARIRATQNTATIQELGDDPEVLAWLRSVGLTPYEAARIQPQYPCGDARRGDCLCELESGGFQLSDPIVGVAEATIAALGDDPQRVEVTVTAVHGRGATIGDALQPQRVYGDAPGQKILVVLRDASSEIGAYRGAEPLASGSVMCTTYDGMAAQVTVDMPEDLYIAALLSADCMGAVVAHDADLAAPVCDPDAPQADPDPLVADVAPVISADPAPNDDGCGGGQPSFLGLVMLTALVAWSRMRRSPERQV